MYAAVTRVVSVRRVVPLVLACSAFVLYAVYLVPGVLSGDAGELAYHPLRLGIPHPTGYPLYLLTGRVWLWLVPWGEPAWRMNLFNAFWGAPAVGWLTVLLWRRMPGWVALAGGIALAITRDVWRYSTETAVYSLHVFVHVLDSQGNVVAQADHEPQDGRAPTAGWLPSEVVRDEVTLPVTPQSDWRIRVGWYDPITGARLSRGDGGDAVDLAVP